MTVSLDARQSLVEIQYAMHRHLPKGSGDLAECNVMVGGDESIIGEAERRRV